MKFKNGFRDDCRSHPADRSNEEASPTYPFQGSTLIRVCKTQGKKASAYHWAIFLDLALPKPGLGPLSGSQSGHEPEQNEAYDSQEAHWNRGQGLHHAFAKYKFASIGMPRHADTHWHSVLLG